MSALYVGWTTIRGRRRVPGSRLLRPPVRPLDNVRPVANTNSPSGSRCKWRDRRRSDAEMPFLFHAFPGGAGSGDDGDFASVYSRSRSPSAARRLPAGRGRARAKIGVHQQVDDFGVCEARVGWSVVRKIRRRSVIRGAVPIRRPIAVIELLPLWYTGRSRSVSFRREFPTCGRELVQRCCQGPSAVIVTALPNSTAPASHVRLG